MDSKLTLRVVSTTLGLAFCGPVAIGGESSLTDSKTESPESNAVLAIEKLVAENKRLRGEIQTLNEVAANATSEAEVFKRQVTEISQRMEALGASTASPSMLEQRVLQAANATRHAETSQVEATTALARLARMSGELSQASSPEMKLIIDAELKSVDELLGRIAMGPVAEPSKASAERSLSLMKGTVSAMKPELGCIVINLGQKQGVKVGMPFQVRRGDKKVALVRVVDVRQTFSGAVIQKQLSEKEQIRLGDAIVVDAQL